MGLIKRIQLEVLLGSANALDGPWRMCFVEQNQRCFVNTQEKVAFPTVSTCQSLSFKGPVHKARLVNNIHIEFGRPKSFDCESQLLEKAF